MRVLMVHAAYQQRGGEDSVVDTEVTLLRDHGHEVQLYLRHNDEATSAGRISVASQALWSRRSEADVGRLVETFKPDVVHVHNTWPMVSPSVYWPAFKAGVPVVQTLHNFRLMCPQAMFLREGKICEDCLGTLPWRGVLRGCYRKSRVQTALLASTVQLHRAVGSYERAVTLFVALSAFSKSKFVQGGLDADRIVIKPNFVEDTGDGMLDQRTGGLFVGRLSDEKGISVLLDALRLGQAPVTVIGDGDWGQQTRQQLGDHALGFRPVAEILSRMKSAAYLVLPSLCGENFPRTIAEAYSCGLPVIASRLGAMAELVDDGKTGLLFEVGNVRDLADKLAWAEAHPQEMLRMGRAARQRYLERYTPDRNHDELMAIYRKAQSLIRTR
jgi:glycosyltransferase involved in cell wall biosynthesis